MRTKIASTVLVGCVSGLFLALSDDSLAMQADLTEFADGRVDATDALQNAIDTSTGLLEIPPGKYRLTRPLVVDLSKTGYREIRGSAASALQMTAAGPALRIIGTHFKSADPAGFSDAVWQRERMPLISGLAIEGLHAEADGIEALGTMQLTVSHVHFRKLRHGVHLIENNRNVIIDHCHIYECGGIGIYYDQVNLHQSNIVGCHVSYCDQGGIVSRGGNVRNIHITGCDIESNMAASQPPTANILIDCRESNYGTAEVAITGCTIQHNDAGPDSANIRILGNSKPTERLPLVREGNITITGNVLSDVQTNIHLDGCRGVTLTGNTFWMGFKYNLLIENSAHIVMGPNNFDRNPRYDYGNSNASENRIVIRDCRDSTISGLHISHVTGDAAVTLQSCHRFNVSGLTILDCDIGLYLDDVSSSVFTGCLIRDARTGSTAARVVVNGGIDNRFDATLESTNR